MPPLVTVVAYVLLGLVFFNPVLRHDATFSYVAGSQDSFIPWSELPDEPRVFFPQSDYTQTIYGRQAFMSRAIDEGVLPEWNPHAFGGHPYLSIGAATFFYPPRLLLSEIAPPWWAHDLYLFGHMVGAGLAAHLLARSLGLRRSAAFLAGLAWMWNSYFMAWAQLEFVAPVMVMLPLGLYAVRRFVASGRWRWIGGAGLACGSMLLGASADFATTSTGVVALYALGVSWWRVRSTPDRSRRDRAVAVLGPPALLGIVALGVGAAAMLPFLGLSSELARDPIERTSFLRDVAVQLEDLLFAFRPDVAAGSPPVNPVTMTNMLFVGTATAWLAVIGLFRRGAAAWLGRYLLVGGALAIVASPLTSVWYELLPGFSFFQLGRFVFLLDLGIVLLGAVGLEVVLEHVPRLPPVQSRLGWLQRAARPERARAAMQVAVVVVVLGTVGVQLFDYGRLVNPPFQARVDRYLFPETPFIEALTDRRDDNVGDRYLPLALPTGPPVVGASIPMVFDLEYGGGYESALPIRTAAVWRLVGGEPIDDVLGFNLSAGLVTFYRTDSLAPELLDRFGITTIGGAPGITAEPGWDPTDPANDLTLLYDGFDGTVMARDGAVRAFVVSDVEHVADGDEALRRYVADDFPWRERLVFEGDGEDVDGAPVDADVRVVERTTNGLDLEVESDGDGWLVVLDSYDDGWRATVDGEPVEVRRANYNFRAVPISAGSSRVEMRYEMPGLDLAIALTVSTTLGVLAGGVVGVVQDRRRATAPTRRPSTGGSAGG